jgi:hypothetical protein
VRLAAGQVQRILADYLRDQPGPLADDATRAARRAACRACPDLQYGTTCRHCGCLVEVRACLADKGCPAPVPRWEAVSGSSQ